MNDQIQKIKDKLENLGIPVFESNRKGFDYFIPEAGDVIPISDDENESIQGFGVHLTERELIEFSETV